VILVIFAGGQRAKNAANGVGTGQVVVSRGFPVLTSTAHGNRFRPVGACAMHISIAIATNTTTPGDDQRRQRRAIRGRGNGQHPRNIRP
jgi:hypothetical protein